jgi:chromosome segregation ATPase
MSSLKEDLNAIVMNLDSFQNRLVEKVESIAPPIVHTVETLSGMSNKVVKNNEVMVGQLNEIYSLQKDAAAAGIPQSLRLLVHATETLQREVEAVKQCQISITPTTSKIQSLEGHVTELLGRLEVQQQEKSELLHQSKASESECNILGLRLRDLEVEISAKSEESQNYRAQNKALQESLTQTVTRLDTTGASLEKSWARACELEAAHRELQADKNQLRTKVSAISCYQLPDSFVTISRLKCSKCKPTGLLKMQRPDKRRYRHFRTIVIVF